jgi:hypothetical protein
MYVYMYVYMCVQKKKKKKRVGSRTDSVATSVDNNHVQRGLFNKK